jgi:hypothetical protein
MIFVLGLRTVMSGEMYLLFLLSGLGFPVLLSYVSSLILAVPSVL